jgi:hypothetical protein
MSKSTPIDQLPQNILDDGIINDQQRNIVNQAQNAIQNSIMPQNTSGNSDIINDDDATIQEVLNSIESGNTGNTQTQHITQMSVDDMSGPQLDEYRRERFKLENSNNNPNNNINTTPPPVQGNNEPIQRNIIDNLIMNNPELFSTSGNDSTKWFIFDDLKNDIKSGFVVFLIIIAVQLISFETYLGKYISREVVVNHKVMIRALVGFILFILIKKLLIS